MFCYFKEIRNLGDLFWFLISIIFQRVFPSVFFEFLFSKHLVFPLELYHLSYSIGSFICGKRDSVCGLFGSLVVNPYSCWVAPSLVEVEFVGLLPLVRGGVWLCGYGPIPLR